jgi:selenocysteine lyase/cysteine desulfurase
MATLREYERGLGQHFLDALPDSVTVYGLQTMEGRVPTFLLNVEGVPAAEVATTLAERGYGVWAHDSWYSLGMPFPYPGDAVRVGFLHYNTVEEVDGFVGELAAFAG